MSRSGDFRGDNQQTDRQMDRQANYFTPVHGVKIRYGVSDAADIDTKCLDTELLMHAYIIV